MLKKIFYQIIGLLLLLNQTVAADNNAKADSLKQLVNPSINDTLQVRVLNQLAQEIVKNNSDEALIYANRALSLSKKLNFKSGEANSLNSVGTYHYAKNNFSEAMTFYEKAYALASEIPNKEYMSNFANSMGLCKLQQSEFDKAMDYFNIALKYSIEIKNDRMVANSYNGIANAYESKGQYSEALKMHLKALDLYEKLNNKGGLAKVYGNIGGLYKSMNKLPLAIEYSLKSLELKKQMNDKRGLAFSYNNIGMIYRTMKQYDKAIDYFNNSLKIKEELGDKKGYANSLNNLGSLYSELGDSKKALDYYMRSLVLKEEIKDRKGLSSAYTNIGREYINTKDPDKAVEYLEKGLALATEINSMEDKELVYGSLANAYVLKNNFKKAYDYLQLFTETKDSLLNVESSKQITEMQTKYDSEKKEKEIELQSAKLGQKEIELKKQHILNYSIFGGLLLFMTLAFFIYRGYRTKQKANIIITKQKEEVEYQKSIIEEKKQEIQDSINYAKQIQRAILPNPNNIQKAFPQSFGLYKPKDVVSGDFYWFAEHQGKAMIAAADCTGHGVPGAFMSMIGIDKLNHAVLEQKLTDPSAILSSLNNGVKTALKQNETGSTSRDGMDIALCSFDIVKNTLEFAGANRPLYHINDGRLTEYAGTKAPIGGLTGNSQEYQKHSIPLTKGDSIYIFTDGFADQFGGPKGKKFMTKQLKEILLSIQNKTMDEQEALLEKRFNEWKKNLDQIDDILVIGIRI